MIECSSQGMTTEPMSGQSWDEDPSHMASWPVPIPSAKPAWVQDVIVPWGCLYFIILQFSLVVSSFVSHNSLLNFFFFYFFEKWPKGLE